MFGFLKDKLKNALGKFSKDVEKEAVIEKKEVIVDETVVSKDKDSEKDTNKHTDNNSIPQVKKEGFFHKLFGKKEQASENSDFNAHESDGYIPEKNTKPVLSESLPEAKADYKQQPHTTISRNKANEDMRDSSEKKVILQKEDNEYQKKKHVHKTALESDNNPVTVDTLAVHNKIKSPEVHRQERIQDQIKREEPIPRNAKEEKISENNIQESAAHEKKNFDRKSHREENEKGDLRHVQESTIIIEPVEYAVHKSQDMKDDASKDASSDINHLSKSKVPVQEETLHEKKGFFTRITETFTKFSLSEEKFEELFWDLEVVLLENNVAVEVIDKIKSDMKQELMNGKISRKGVDELILSTLKKSIIELFDVEKVNLMEKINLKKASGEPYILAVIGVNGSGKTTSIAKLTYMLQNKGLSVVMAASDTFRAAAIQQLEEHAIRLKTKIIKHDYHSDPAAVAFDAIKYAKAHSIDVVIIDTAGRLHSNTNLMEELKKVVRVCNPDIKIFVGESITGNDCVEQAKEFDKAVGIDAIILAKADVDEKGGAAISVSYVTQKPILYLGTGQTYDDLKEFNSDLIVKSLEL